jgi:hypothetical protein
MNAAGQEFVVPKDGDLAWAMVLVKDALQAVETGREAVHCLPPV